MDSSSPQLHSDLFNSQLSTSSTPFQTFVFFSSSSITLIKILSFYYFFSHRLCSLQPHSHIFLSSQLSTSSSNLGTLFFLFNHFHQNSTSLSLCVTFTIYSNMTSSDLYIFISYSFLRKKRYILSYFISSICLFI